MDTKDERLQIRLPGELFRKFKAHVAMLGKSMSEVTEELLQEWLATQESTPEPTSNSDK